LPGYRKFPVLFKFCSFTSDCNDQETLYTFRILHRSATVVTAKGCTTSNLKEEGKKEEEKTRQKRKERRQQIVIDKS